jgi:hypothetical protein
LRVIAGALQLVDDITAENCQGSVAFLVNQWPFAERQRAILLMPNLSALQ